jgi:probable HAF family extracellular repeat protein
VNIISKWLAVLVMLSGPIAANAQSYTFTDLGTLGGSDSTAYGINNAGQIVGWSEDANGVQTATLWNGTMATALGFLAGYTPSEFAYAVGINNAGQIVGVTSPYGGGTPTTATVWNGTTPTALSGSGAFAINAAGKIGGYSATVEGGFSEAIEWIGTTATVLISGVGCYCEVTALNNVGQILVASDGGPVLFNGTTPTFLNSLGAEGGAYPSGMNDAGQIVGSGYFFETNMDQAVLWNDTTPTILGTLGGVNTAANAINNLGQIVGYSTYADSSNDTANATIWKGTTPIDLNTLATLPQGFQLNEAIAINDSGQIVGYGTNSENQFHAFLLTPLTQIPTVTPLITGTLGTNGWYVSMATTLAWTVTGFPTPPTSGCRTVTAPQTRGIPYTCSATNSAGSASDTVTIKEDSVPPLVIIKVPTKGETFALHANVPASYFCLDSTSGVASCTGTVKDGTRINTDTKGTKTFRVTGTDNAGNERTISVLYNVD